MQPAQSGNAKQKSTALKRFGPIAGLVAAAGIGVGALAFSGNDDKEEVTAKPSETVASASSAPVATEVSTATDLSSGTQPTKAPEVTFPLAFSQANEQGITVEWGDRCDESIGRLAFPNFFAPECFAPFTGDNGGATSPGVTADEITIAYYQGQENDPIIAYITDAINNDDTNAQGEETMRNLVALHETFYETYGRKVKLVVVQGSGGALDEVAARADAVRIAEEIKPFMVWGGPTLTNAFADELAARKVMCLACTPGQPPEWFAERDPFVWGIDRGAEQAQDHVVEYITKQLVGKPASHAGDQFVGQTRTFGYLYIESGANSKVLADKFAASMSAGGAPLVETVAYQLDPGTIQQQASQAIAKFKAAGVTTVVFAGDPVAPRDFTKEATAQGYSPEWVIAAATLTDVNAFARTYDQEQWSHAFGVSTLATRLNPSESGSFLYYKWFTGQDPPAIDSIGVISPIPAVFYAALQNAGPNLTPQMWRDGLFANPPTQTAISQPSLSWGDHGLWPYTDYAGTDDATAIWWDPTATGPDEIRREGTGMYQFVDGGERYLPGEWPTEDKAFVTDGAVSLYTTPPPGEAPKEYPSPAG